MGTGTHVALGEVAMDSAYMVQVVVVVIREVEMLQ